ncbi:reverse transcriptase domain-containing protein [Tanacetum coccineum]
MSTQQDIYASGSETRPPMLNKENYVPWSSHLICYAKIRPNGKLIYNSIVNGLYVRRMIPEPGDADREVEADDQAIQTILLGLPEDIYAAVDSCENTQEIWLGVQQMMKHSDIGIQEKKAMLFNEWERFTSTNGESIESCYHSYYTQLYDFLKYNQKEIDDLRAERLAKTHEPLALMENSNNPFNYPVFNPDQPSSSNRMIAQPGINLGQDRHIQIVGGNGGNQFRQFAGQNIRNQNGYNVVQNVENQNPNRNGNVVAALAEGNANGNNGNQIRCYNCRGLGHLARNCIVRPRRRDAAYLQTQLLIAQKKEAGI